MDTGLNVNCKLDSKLKVLLVTHCAVARHLAFALCDAPAQRMQALTNSGKDTLGEQDACLSRTGWRQDSEDM